MALKVHSATHNSRSPKELLSVLKDCSRCRDLLRGRSAHTKAIQLGFGSDTYVANTLISMYAKCGSMVDARKVFDALSGPGVVSWTCLIQGYVENGDGELALEMFERMEQTSKCVPDARTYVAALSACANIGAKRRAAAGKWLAKGKVLHSQAVMNQCCNIFVESMVVKMYASFGSMKDAQCVFDRMSRRDVVSWTTLLQGYNDNGENEMALQMFERMHPEKVWPDSRTYVAALMACSALGTKHSGKSPWLEKGRAIHSMAAERRCCNIFVENAAIVMYSSCGSMTDARSVFYRMAQRDVVTFTSMLQGYVENDEHELAVDLFNGMDSPDARAFAVAISACASLTTKSRNQVEKWLEKGKNIYARALNTCCCDIFVENALLSLFAQSGNVAHARKFFDNMSRRDVVSWTTLLQGYVNHGESELALELYDCMQHGVCEPDARAYVAALTACATLAAARAEKRGSLLEKGKEIHYRALKSNCCNIFVENSLVDMYVKCGGINQAREVVDGLRPGDGVAWTCLMQGYVDTGECELALKVFHNMSDSLVDGRTYVAALGACAGLGGETKDSKWLDTGKSIHSRALRNGHCDAFVENALIEMYSKCGGRVAMVEATRVFESMVELSVVSWTSLLTGYVDSGENDLAMQVIENAVDHPAVVVTALKACANLMALETGKSYHARAERHGFTDDDTVTTSLVELYGKCGNTELAQLVFDTSALVDIWMWNSLLCGYSQQGDMYHALGSFQEMRERSVPPDEFTFTHILTVCSHSGLTEKGKAVFEAMSSKYKVNPNVVHYNCLMDSFGRANKVEKAMEIAATMPCKADVVTWTTILSACTKWNNVKLGKVAYENLLKLSKDGVVVNYVLMANLNVFGNKTERAATTTWMDKSRRVHKFTDSRH